MTSKSNGKLTLSGSKNTLTLGGLKKEDILKKISDEGGEGFITRKGEEIRPSKFTSNAFTLSNEERKKRMQALENQTKYQKSNEKSKEKSEEYSMPKNTIEDEALSSLEIQEMEEVLMQIPQEVKSFNASDAIKTTIKVEISKQTTEAKKEEKPSSQAFFKQSESVIPLNEIPQEIQIERVDNRDKTLINQMMKHYKYLEFDSDEEIESLQKGLELRQALESKRKDIQQNISDDDVIVSSSSLEMDEGVIKIRREAYFSRHSRKSNKKKTVKPNFIQKEVEIYDKNTVIDIARAMAIKVEEFIKKLRYYGLNVKENDTIDGDAAELVIEEMGHTVKRLKRLTAEDKIQKAQIFANLKSVVPVVTIMGHVDHGKTSLLDALRNSKVAEKEAGGITQHIGSYQTELPNGKKITFIDTPGHEAFTAIRSRGASITHVIVIVIAGDDGIMPQTLESINHAKKSQVPIVIAINKIDKPNADIQKIKNELLAHEIVSDDLGGDVICVPISAKTGQNLDKLCDAILLQAEVFDAKAEFDVPASGVVLEGKLSKQKGVFSSLLVQNGTLKVGDILVIGSSYSKIRLMLNDKGESIKTAEPSTPVEVYGLPDVPTPGQSFNVVLTEKLAREIAEHRKDKKTEQKTDIKSAFLNFLGTKSEVKQFNIVIRADAQSTIEAIKYALSQIKLPSEIEIKIMQSSVGDVTEADIKYAKSYNAVIFAFSTKVGTKEQEIARKNEVIIKEHAIIYNIVDDVKELISKQLSPIIKDEIIGEAEVREIFDIFKIGKIAGSVVKKGVIRRNAIVKIFRGNAEAGEGKLKTLKHFKENVKELAQGNECGVQVEGFEGFKPGDVLQIIERTEEKRTL